MQLDEPLCLARRLNVYCERTSGRDGRELQMLDGSVERQLDWLFPKEGWSKQLAPADEFGSGRANWKVGLEGDRVN